MADRMEEIKGRLAKATQGPLVAAAWAYVLDAQKKIVAHCVDPGDEDPDTTQGHANAEFFAHAPSDLAYLIERAERAERERDAARSALSVAMTDEARKHKRRLYDAALRGASATVSANLLREAADALDDLGSSEIASDLRVTFIERTAAGVTVTDEMVERARFAFTVELRKRGLFDTTIGDAQVYDFREAMQIALTAALGGQHGS